MPDYKALYFKLFNDVTDTIERLKEAQQKAEQEYMDEESPEDSIIRPFHKKHAQKSSTV